VTSARRTAASLRGMQLLTGRSEALRVTRSWRRSAWVMLAAVFLAACSGSTHSSSRAALGSAPTSSSSVAPALHGESTGGWTPSTTGAPVAGQGGSAGFCAVLKQITALPAPTSTTQAASPSVQALMAELERLAPPEVSSYAHTFAVRSAKSSSAAGGASAIQVAGQHLNDYSSRHCGFPLGGGFTP